jgi:hypothetical protein
MNYIWIGNKPNVSHLREFDYIAFVLILVKNRKKLDYKSKECIFIRYSEESKGHMLMRKSNGYMFSYQEMSFFKKQLE